MIEHSADIGKLTTALHAAQATLRGVHKDSTNPHFRNKYASLENVIDAAREPLQAAGLAFTQAPGAIVDGAVEITTMLMHTSGQWLRSTLHVPLTKRDAQGVGSAITYGCRYSLMATLGLPPIDDDGESSIDRSPPKREEAPARPPIQQGSLADRAMPAKNIATKENAIEATLMMAIDKAETVSDLNDWAEEPENVNALAKLDADGKDRVRGHWALVRRQLMQERAA